MSDIENIPKQMTLPFNADNSPAKAEVISLSKVRESVLAAQAASLNISDAKESEILKRVLERADRLPWYK